jgi:hypothetical protein
LALALRCAVVRPVVVRRALLVERRVLALERLLPLLVRRALLLERRVPLLVRPLPLLVRRVLLWVAICRVLLLALSD